MYRLFSVAVSIFAVVRVASSQVAPEQPNQFPALQVANPPSTDPAGPPARASEMVRLQFPNSDVADVLHLYEQLTGKKLVMDNFVQGKVNIFIAKDVPRDEAIKIIEMSLALNGISLIPAGRDIVQVVGAGQNPRKAAVPIISDLADIPAGNPVISFLFRLQYADPQELQQVLMAYFQGSSGSINILALPKSSSLLVTQNADIIRQLANVIQQVDVAPAEVVSEFIKLERADASKVCDMLKDIFEKGEKAGQPGIRSVRGAPPVPQPVAVEGEGGGLGGLSEQSIIVGKIKLTADVRTNRIHVVTRPINMPFVRQLIHEFDANVEFAKPVTRPLKYISAGDVLPVLVQSLTEPGAAQPGAEAGGGTGGGTPAPQATPYRTTTGMAANPYTGGVSGTSGTSTEGSLNISEELSTQPVDTTPKAVIVGNAKLIADQRSNAIIVLGSREVVLKVEKILDEMDVKAPQVALSTVIGQLTLNNNEEFGADYFAKYNRRFVGTSNNLAQSLIPVPSAAPSASPIINNGIIDPSNLINFSQIIQNVGSGTNVYVAAGNAFAAIVHVLESTNRFKILSRPTVFTSNNKKAIIASGQEVPVPVSTLSNVGTTTITGTAAVQASIEYKRVVLQLEVVPLINSEREISLDILQKIDSVVPNGQVNISGNEVPTIDTKYLRTNVSAANGSTIILGGLMQEQKQKQYSGIPYLSRIPLIGAAFRGTTSMKQRQELIILMCPQVTLTKLEAFRLRQRYENTTHFGADLDENDCPDCPKTQEGKQLTLPPPDIPEPKDMK